MGNLCPWCRNNADESSPSASLHHGSTIRHSPRASLSPEPTDRTPLLAESRSHNPLPSTVPPPISNEIKHKEPSAGVIKSLTPPQHPPTVVDNLPPLATVKESSDEAAESSMANIVERMFPDLIDVSGWGAGAHPTNSTSSIVNPQMDHLKQLLSKSLQSTLSSPLPDAGTSNLSSLLSGRPVSWKICGFVAHTATELSRQLLDDIKIVHKEALVVTFE